jgi:hypothetical protein
MSKFVATCIDCGVYIAMSTNKKKVLKIAQERHVPNASIFVLNKPSGLTQFIQICTLRATEVKQ